jgi:hypothetical protein
MHLLTSVMGGRIKQDPILQTVFMGLKTIVKRSISWIGIHYLTLVMGVKNEHIRDRASPNSCYESEDLKQASNLLTHFMGVKTIVKNEHTRDGGCITTLLS